MRYCMHMTVWIYIASLFTNLFMEVQLGYYCFQIEIHKMAISLLQWMFLCCGKIYTCQAKSDRWRNSLPLLWNYQTENWLQGLIEEMFLEKWSGLLAWNTREIMANQQSYSSLASALQSLPAQLAVQRFASGRTTWLTAPSTPISCGADEETIESPCLKGNSASPIKVCILTQKSLISLSSFRHFKDSFNAWKGYGTLTNKS